MTYFPLAIRFAASGACGPAAIAAAATAQTSSCSLRPVRQSWAHHESMLHGETTPLARPRESEIL